MNTKTLTRNTCERGYTLIEILVAVVIFAVIILAALLLYDRSNQVFKQNVEASDMQQSTRVAFDKLAADLRMAGFDYDRDGTPMSALATTWAPNTTYTAGMLVQPTNPNGHTYICIAGGMSDASEPLWPVDSGEEVTEGGGSTLKWQEDGELQYQQPDEQIEYAGRSAVVLRANFNYSTATGECTGMTPCEGGREPKYESTEFPVVTIANNEIVAYALRPVKWASGESADTLEFYADTAIPRDVSPSSDKKEPKITISGVDLCDNGCNSPPYTLYRYTVQENGTPDAGTPVAENVRDVRYRYYTTSSAAAADEITTYPNGGGQYNGAMPDATVAERDTRASIRSVELTLVGMNPQPDYNYTNPTDTVAKNYRTLELKSLITPRNAGRRGMKEYNTNPPGLPEIQSVCIGACNAPFLTWTAPSDGGDIESYAILYDPDPCVGNDMPTGGYQYSEEVGLNLSGSAGRFIQPGQTYSFAVQAINKWGPPGQSKCMGPYKVLNATKPDALNELIATNPSNPVPFGVVKNQIDLYFPPSGPNVDGEDLLSCSGGNDLEQDVMPPQEKRNYEVWRGTEIDFQPGDGKSVKVLDAATAVQPVSAGTVNYMKWTDLTAANCKDYYYRIRVVDYCARKPEWNASGDASQATSAWFPDLGEKAIHGRAENYDAKPEKPVLTMSKAECTGVNCKLTFTWGAVTKNTVGEPITVDKYILRGYTAAADGTYPTYPADPDHLPFIDPGALTTTVTVKDVDLTKFVLVAVDCQESAESNAVIYPCVFNAGNLALTVSGGEFGGSGSAGDPYIIESATLLAKTDSNVSEFRMAIFDTTDGSQFAASTQTGSASSATFGIPNTPDGRLMRVLITAVDDKGCTKVSELYVSDTAAPACSLTDIGTKPALRVINKTNVVFTLENTSSNDLTVKKVFITYDSSNAKDLLASVGFNGTTVTTTCTKESVVFTAPASSVVAKSSSTYKLQLNYAVGNLLGTDPTKSICVQYQVPTGDILSCQMHPSAATCAEPASACQ